jgi:hypothetical protein
VEIGLTYVAIRTVAHPCILAQQVGCHMSGKLTTQELARDPAVEL